VARICGAIAGDERGTSAPVHDRTRSPTPGWWLCKVINSIPYRPEWQECLVPAYSIRPFSSIIHADQIYLL
jgi:hypothetical protein